MFFCTRSTRILSLANGVHVSACLSVCVVGGQSMSGQWKVVVGSWGEKGEM